MPLSHPLTQIELSLRYSDHLLAACTVEEANRIWCKAQDSVKHKYQRIMKNNPNKIKISAYERQLARNVSST